ncbi:hypothetical protein ACFV6E_18055 [Streptomyces sp. NPDC059785]|uniref:hypothetical protein n=1 Tax=unclassified Streptomyces TaxID=2593676 RepID=UPI0036648AF9
MGSSDGYQIKSKSGMAGQAGELSGAGDDMELIRAAVPAVTYTADTLGSEDAVKAFHAFATAWETEAKTLAEALHELGNKVRLSKGAYAGADGLVETGANDVSVGESSLTPTSAPAGRSSALSAY